MNSVEDLDAMIARKNESFEKIRADHKAEISDLNAQRDRLVAGRRVEELLDGMSESDRGALLQSLAPKGVVSAEKFGKI